MLEATVTGKLSGFDMWLLSDAGEFSSLLLLFDLSGAFTTFLEVFGDFVSSTG